MATLRVWLVTGASSGFGKALTEFVLSRGEIVVATLRKPEMLRELSASHSKDRLLVLKVDVTNQADIDRAFAQTKEAFGRLDVVFNNAGYVIFGDVETTPDDAARALFEVNFWGAANVSKAAVKFFREVNEPGRGGVLLQNSSDSTINSVPGLTMYSASKHAFDGFSEGLAKEVLPKWNIKICIIQPGAFNTSAILNGTVLPENPVYNDEASMLTIFRSLLSTSGFSPDGDPIKFAKAIYWLVEGGNIPLHLPIGQDALTKAKERIMLLGKELSEAAPWSADLLLNRIGLLQ